MEENPTAQIPEDPKETLAGIPPFTKTPNEVESNPKNFSMLLGILAIFILALGIAIGYKFSQKPAQPTPTPEAVVTPTPDPTATWETYTNIKYGFMVKYPEKWYLYEPKETVAQTKSTIGFWPAKGEGEVQGIWVIVRNDQFSYESLDSWWLQYKKQMLVPIDEYQIDEKKSLEANFDTWIDIQNITIGNTPALEVETKQGYPSKPYKSVYIMDKNQEIIEINTNITSVEDPNSLVFNQILSTFKFTDQTGVNPSAVSINPLNKTYKDKDYNYSISYPDSWTFRRTYGKDIEKLAPTDILSGIDLTKGDLSYMQATIVLNLLDSHGLVNPEEWISKYDLNYPKNATKTVVPFNGMEAVQYKYKNSTERDNEAYYFINGRYTYRIYVDEKGGISDLTRQVFNSIRP